MEKDNAEYVVRDFSAVDLQVAEMAKRENILTWRLKIDNIKRLGIPLILLACALAILIVALGIFIWLAKEPRVVEIDKIVEVTREVPIISEKIKVVEVPVYIEVPKVQTNNTETSSTTEVQPSLGNLSLGVVEREVGSTKCVNSLSYNSKCVDTWEYPNGMVYDGSWYQGKPHGNGSITFKDGGTISGSWLNGELQKVATETKSTVTPLKSVTYFSSKPGVKIAKNFPEITAGHNFDSGADKQWKTAFCYIYIRVKNGDEVRKDLSRYASFDGKLKKLPYKKSDNISLKQFNDAQKECPYSWNGFN